MKSYTTASFRDAFKQLSKQIQKQARKGESDPLVWDQPWLSGLYAAPKIRIAGVLHGVAEADVVEDYPEYFKGPSVLVLQKDENGLPIHVVWGIPKGAATPAVLVTGYRPQPDRWSGDFKKRL